MIFYEKNLVAKFYAWLQSSLPTNDEIIRD